MTRTSGGGAVRPRARTFCMATGAWTWARAPRWARATIRQNTRLMRRPRTALSWAGPVATAHPDFVVYNTSLAGSATQATIAAFTNLYVGTCTTVSVDSPNTYWAYNTGTAGAVVTSVVLSGDGNQVAFVQNNATTATLVLLKWAAYDGFLAGPTTPVNSATAADYNTCVTTTRGPCMFTITFSTANGGAAAFDTNSSPFYDYAHDTLYVGNDTGYLHKFTPVFNGAPAEVVSSTAGSNLAVYARHHRSHQPCF